MPMSPWVPWGRLTTRWPVATRRPHPLLPAGQPLTAASVLAAYYIGLGWDSSNLALAQTMAFVTLSASELLRAYTARSERVSLLRLGVFSNKFMQYAILLSITLLLGVVYIPFFQSIFNTVPLGLQEWSVVLPLLLVPGVSAEITKAFTRSRARQRAAAVTG